MDSTSLEVYAEFMAFAFPESRSTSETPFDAKTLERAEQLDRLARKALHMDLRRDQSPPKLFVERAGIIEVIRSMDELERGRRAMSTLHSEPVSQHRLPPKCSSCTIPENKPAFIETEEGGLVCAGGCGTVMSEDLVVSVNAFNPHHDNLHLIHQGPSDPMAFVDDEVRRRVGHVSRLVRQAADRDMPKSLVDEAVYDAKLYIIERTRQRFQRSLRETRLRVVVAAALVKAQLRPWRQEYDQMGERRDYSGRHSAVRVPLPLQVREELHSRQHTLLTKQHGPGLVLLHDALHRRADDLSIVLVA